jgi:hypothetical protein
MVNLKVLDTKCKKIRSAVKDFLEYNNDCELTDTQIELIIDKTMIDLSKNLFNVAFKL